jgi:ribosomal protein L25 (general stress protein Ctc)
MLSRIASKTVGISTRRAKTTKPVSTTQRFYPCRGGDYSDIKVSEAYDEKKLAKYYERLSCAMGHELHKLSQTKGITVNAEIMAAYYGHRQHEINVRVDSLENQIKKLVKEDGLRPSEKVVLTTCDDPKQQKVSRDVIGAKYVAKIEIENQLATPDSLAKGSFKWTIFDTPEFIFLMGKQRKKLADESSKL